MPFTKAPWSRHGACRSVSPLECPSLSSWKASATDSSEAPSDAFQQFNWNPIHFPNAQTRMYPRLHVAHRAPPSELAIALLKAGMGMSISQCILGCTSVELFCLSILQHDASEHNSSSLLPYFPMEHVQPRILHSRIIK